MAASETYSKFFLRDYHAECHTILLEQRKNQSMLNLNSIFIGSDNPKGLGSSFLSIGPHSKIKGKAKEPQRIILNLTTDEVKEEYERMVKLGAVSIKEPYEIEGMWIATLADPDGNYFQLMNPWKG